MPQRTGSLTSLPLEVTTGTTPALARAARPARVGLVGGLRAAAGAAAGAGRIGSFMSVTSSMNAGFKRSIDTVSSFSCQDRVCSICRASR